MHYIERMGATVCYIEGTLLWRYRRYRVQCSTCSTPVFFLMAYPAINKLPAPSTNRRFVPADFLGITHTSEAVCYRHEFPRRDSVGRYTFGASYLIFGLFPMLVWLSICLT